MRFLFSLSLALFLAAPALALEPDADPDMELGKEINITCAACHGEFGAGGKGGIYPRLAGMRVEYLIKQLLDFRSRKRLNIPMIPYANDRELPDEDLKAVAHYLASIKLDNHLPEIDPDDPPDGLARLNQAKMVVQIPRAPGNLERGKEIYRECSSCHGRQGQGKVKGPPLAGQYIPYLEKQMELFATGERHHHDDEDLRTEFTADTDIRDVMAYLSILDD